MESNEINNNKYGSDFSWNDGNVDNLFYIEHAPYFSDIRGNEKILNFNDKLVYESAENEILINLDISEDGKDIFFLVMILKQ